MANLTADFSQFILFIGVLAFVVSVITEALKKWEWFDKKVPTALVVICLSLVLCPVAMLGMMQYLKQPIEWYMVFASFVAAFIVALVAMDGWERVTELAEKLIKKGITYGLCHYLFGRYGRSDCTRRKRPCVLYTLMVQQAE